MTNLLNVSSPPHLRSKLTTGTVMYDVILALMPATIFGIYHFGFHAFLVLATSVLSAVMSEFVFDYLAHRPNTLRDGSAVVTGLLLGLCLPPSVPLYIPYLGSLFAILIVKCFFGGLGQNFMNPAMAGRCFLLISFSSVMTNYAVEGISDFNPLDLLTSGSSVNVLDMFLGFTTGTIGVSCAALLVGAVYLLIIRNITWHVPVSYLGTFLVVLFLLNGATFDVTYYLAQLCGGGLLLGAFFMATDPVSSPVTGRGQIIFGIVLGIVTAIFRYAGSAVAAVGYAIVLGNILVPLIDRISVPAPFGLGDNAKKPKPKVPKPAVVLTVITLITGVALGGAYQLTKDTIEQHAIEANAAAYQAVMPHAVSFGYDDAISANVQEFANDVYGRGTYGNVYINEVVEGFDDAGEVIAYAVNVSTTDGYESTITLSVGFDLDGTILGLSFTELAETAGMGMRVDEDAFKDQFIGANVDSFTLNKAGGSTAVDEIDSVSGASTTSGAVVNAVNAAINFFHNYI